MLDATFAPLTSVKGDEQPDESAKTKCSSHATKTEELFTKMALEEGHKDRSALLALLELEKRARIHGVSNGRDNVLFLFIMNSHFFQIPIDW